MPVASARLHAQNARDSLALFRQMREARHLASRWELMDMVVKIVAPTGLRERKITEGLEKFNAKLAPLCQAAGWPTVAISGDDLGTTYGGRVYSLISKSAQLKARIIEQLAMADLDGSDLVIIDEVDMLDAKGRNQLFRLLPAVELPALVAMTLSRPSLAPDLAAKGLGATWWLSEGVAAPIAEAQFAERDAQVTDERQREFVLGPAALR